MTLYDTVWNYTALKLSPGVLCFIDQAKGAFERPCIWSGSVIWKLVHIGFFIVKPVFSCTVVVEWPFWHCAMVWVKKNSDWAVLPVGFTELTILPHNCPPQVRIDVKSMASCKRSFRTSTAPITKVSFDLYVVGKIKTKYLFFLFKNMFCAGAPGKDSCQGDSGGKSQHFIVPVVFLSDPGVPGVLSMGPVSLTHWGTLLKS